MRKKTKKEPKNRLDIRAVAKASGVSIATVSRVINNKKSVDEKLSKRVWSAVGHLGYIPNTQARALVSGNSKLLGVLISEITNPFFPELIQGFEDKAVTEGYETLIGSTNYDLVRMELCVRRMLERKVEGVAVMTFGIEEPLLERLSSQGIPMVFIDLAPHKRNTSTIRVNYDKGIREAVQHLAVLGHRKIAFIAGPPALHSAEARLQAFKEASSSIGLRVPSNYVVHGNHTVEGGTKCMHQLLSLTDPPTAVMCSNDVTAIGSMHAIVRAGLRVPDDVSLIGFDDIQLTEFFLPPLTTVRMSGRDIAACAVAALVSKDGLDREVNTRLIVRQSTSIPRGALSDLSSKASKRRKK
jgi:LacI family transcriptional regulator